jgi:hypothetical protein
LRITALLHDATQEVRSSKAASAPLRLWVS